MKDGTDRPDSVRDQKDAEIAGRLEKWPEVAEPTGGYAGLLDRVEKRMSSGGNGANDAPKDGKAKSDPTAAPDLPAEAGEPKEDGPKRDRDSQAYIAVRASLAAGEKADREPKRPGGLSAEGAESGKIDLKSLLSQGLDLQGGPGAAGAAPPKLAAATPLMPAQTAPVVARPEKKSNAGIIVALALAAGVGGFFVLQIQGSDEPAGSAADEPAGGPSAEPATEIAAAAEPAPAERRAAQAETAAPEAADPSAEREVGRVAVADTRRAEGGRDRPDREARPRETAGGGAAATAAPAPQQPAATAAPATAAPAKRGSGGDDLDALLSGAAGGGGAAAAGGGGAAAAPEAAPAGALAQPNRGQIQTAMNRVSPAVRNCTQGTPGTAMVRVTFEHGGTVTSANVTSGYTGAVASCIEGAVRGARVPPFTNATVTVTFPFVVRPPE